MSDEVRIQSLQRGFDIVEYLVDQGESTLSELSSHLEVPESTVYDYLLTLNQLRYVVKEGSEYRVSSELLYMGVSARSQLPVFQLARPEIDKLASETGEHVSLTVEEFGKGVLLYIEKGEQALDLGVSDGYRVELQTTAPGKAIMAHLEPDRIEAIVDKYGLPKKTENTISSKEELLDELEQVRQRGYATDIEERVEGVRAVAAPIVTGGTIRGAIAVSGPANRMTGDWFENDLPDLLLQSTNVIEIQYTLD